MKLTIIVPLYNEKKRIVQLIAKLKNFLLVTHVLEVDFLLVDDGSSDGTKEIALDLIQNHKKIKILSYDQNAGKGAAVFFGFHSAESDYVGFMDADLATPLNHIDEIMKIIRQEKPDFIIGNRRFSPVIYENILRTFASNFFNHIAHLPLKNRYPDTQAGFKFYSKKFKEDLIRSSKIKNYAFDIEHLMIAEILGSKIFDYPIKDWHNGDNSKVNLLKDGIKMFNSCINLLFSRSKYKTNLKQNLYSKDKNLKSDSSDSSDSKVA
jgi:glycosyltransferase involved in cell wall biosynthesis